MPLDPQALEVINLVIKSGRPAYNTLSHGAKISVAFEEPAKVAAPV